MTDDEMAAHLRAKGYRVAAPVDQATCSHPNRRGMGSASSDGSSSFSGYCADCGKDLSYSTPPRPAEPFDPMKWLFWDCLDAIVPRA